MIACVVCVCVHVGDRTVWNSDGTGSLLKASLFIYNIFDYDMREIYVFSVCAIYQTNARLMLHRDTNTHAYIHQKIGPFDFICSLCSLQRVYV